MLSYHARFPKTPPRLKTPTLHWLFRWGNPFFLVTTRTKTPENPEIKKFPRLFSPSFLRMWGFFLPKIWHKKFYLSSALKDRNKLLHLLVKIEGSQQVAPFISNSKEILIACSMLHFLVISADRTPPSGSYSLRNFLYSHLRRHLNVFQLFLQSSPQPFYFF